MGIITADRTDEPPFHAGKGIHATPYQALE